MTLPAGYRYATPEEERAYQEHHLRRNIEHHKRMIRSLESQLDLLRKDGSVFGRGVTDEKRTVLFDNPPE